jgi:SpoVK/Ycf46/Vps4 family AAA+-type ATPase
MPPNKRKFEDFDPNKSDSDDVDFELGTEARPRKASRKSRSGKKTSSTKRRRGGYHGSDVSGDEDDLSIDESFDEASEEEDFDTDPTTGRRKRKAAKEITYEEPDSEVSGIEDVKSDSEEEEVGETPPRQTAKPSKIVTLKVSTPDVRSTRTGRAGSTAHTRSGRSVEPTSSGAQRRSTRAHTEEGEELIALTTSGRHVEVVGGTKSPEPSTRFRPSRGGKGLKKPVSMIKEETQEASSFEQTEEIEEDAIMETEIADAVPEEQEKADSQADADDYDELAANPSNAVALIVDDEDDEDDMPVARTGRTRGSRASISAAVPEPVDEELVGVQPGRRLRTRKAATEKSGAEQGSDFEPPEDSAEDDVSASDVSPQKGKPGSDEDDSGTSRRGRAGAKARSKSNRGSRRRASRSDEDDEDPVDVDELQDELAELKKGSRNRRAPRIQREEGIMYHEPSKRARKPVNYEIKQLGDIYQDDDAAAEELAATPSRGPRGRRNGASQAWERNLYTTYGPFGGAGGPTPVIGGPWGTGATGGVDSDSSDDENMARPSNMGGNVGMTPTSAMPPGLLPGMLNPTDPAAALSGTPANHGKIKSQKALADADPLGVDQDVDFSKVGGLEGHINQLKEMVQMPLLYPELFMKFHVVPPRGVLFHGPPGTGKTLLARALAASVGSGGRKITFYMRKGADALSKWVGEAERQLRLLFEEARKTQPSIIFFDEIDGLAPVRSSKQEQIHASIVSTLLALMDGMDGRGQVIVIGATNRPDNIDPALRRPGRFDREFYFPLPDIEGRKSIININTKDWGIDEAFKDSLAHVTKGYGGADLRALCTEAALNAMQRTYPQIYSSNDKLLVDADKIKITAKDFMLSIKKMIPSSERATSSGAAPLPKVVEPLLREQLKAIETIVDGLIPIKKKVTALQEAMYEQYDDADQGFGRETLQQDFEKSRVFRPRLLIGGEVGMGQAYIGAALLNHFEGLHVQNFDLPTIYSDSGRVTIPIVLILLPLLTITVCRNSNCPAIRRGQKT